MDFALTSDQIDLQATARAWFAKNWELGNIRETLDGSAMPDLRTGLGELGMLGILRDGGSLLDLALVAEEAGRVLAPAALATTARALTLLQAAGVTDLVDQVADGQVAVSVLDGTFALAGTTVSGRCDLASDLGAAEQFLLMAQGPAGSVLARVAATDAGVTWIERPPVDPSRDAGGVILQDAQADILNSDAVAAVWDRARLFSQVVLAAEALGTIEGTLERVVEYAKQRHTFGRAIGSYQAVKHACVDIYVEQELLRTLVWLAAWSADDRPEELALHAAAARALSTSAIEHATDALIQLHGGIGFTWEHDAHLYWRRGRVDRLLLGTTSQHRQTVAELALAGSDA